ncbi:MAG: L,D-transpeptidase [Bacteroidota bacterium]|nr:L,D-transpeptidase [Bacteroidota bacterium]MDE2957634.1 L,D-transpeptidase [Bacteroidota bacterium]
MRLIILAACLIAPATWAQNGSSAPGMTADNLHYVAGRGITLYRDAERTEPYIRLKFREPVVVMNTYPDRYRVYTQDGARGYVRTEDISNLWILVSKRKKQLYLYRGQQLVLQFNADFGYNVYSDKVRRGSEADRDHWRTPEGVFYVVHKNPRSQYYRAFLLNYPNAEDATRGLRTGLISEQEFEAIMDAERQNRTPPMGTRLGGMIEIHGDGTGLSTNWTQGCVAVRNEDMDRLWGIVREGTPVVIQK